MSSCSKKDDVPCCSIDNNNNKNNNNNENKPEEHKEIVKEYYGKTLETSEDLLTNACTSGAPPKFIRKLISNIHPEVISKYYGCGIVFPTDALLEGLKILDLGSGSGRDVYIASQLVGKNGEAVGLDMTDKQLEVANKHISYHMEKFFNSEATNVRFVKGYIENLKDAGLEDNYFDIIISNCVINLSEDKESVLREAYRVLKEGGEFYFSDVYSDRRLDPNLQKDPVLLGECLGGALYWNDFINLCKKVGFKDPRLVKDSHIEIKRDEIKEKLGDAKFYSATYRLFKLPELDYNCEDYGQAVVYLGTLPEAKHRFELDNHHSIETGKVFPVCGNTFDMLNLTRYKDHFTFIGDKSKHFGIFPGCGSPIPFSSTNDSNNDSNGSSACC